VAHAVRAAAVIYSTWFSGDSLQAVCREANFDEARINLLILELREKDLKNLKKINFSIL
jgi:ribosomal protein L12E/L44/L45/RPP1/RPP2